jgi:hypothetical protein
MPTKAQPTTSEQAVADHRSVALQQAIDAAVWGTPIVSFDAMREAFFRDAAASSTTSCCCRSSRPTGGFA